MLLTRSTGTVVCVCSTGMVEPGFRRTGSVPGWQSMKYSPMSDCGRVSHWTSLRMSSKPVSVTSISTSARMSVRSSLRRWIVPARTPPIFTSAPSTRPKALSSSTQ
jgi:hypothetical protein